MNPFESIQEQPQFIRREMRKQRDAGKWICRKPGGLEGVYHNRVIIARNHKHCNKRINPTPVSEFDGFLAGKFV